MKKSFNAGSDVKNESADVIKRLYRTVTEVARQLDDGRSLAEEVGDLFTSSLLLKQSRLKELCERIIFAQPLQYGRKTEELLWRKGFYEVITTAKKLMPKEKWSPCDRAKIQMHLSSATGYYLHVLFRLQVDYDMDLRSIVDFPAILDNTLHLQGTMSPPPEITAEAKEWARQAAHRCLVYLGDLSRYSTEVEPWHMHLELPSRYYLQALMVLPGNGMPHNQLGTVAGTRNYCVDAAYHYMRSITSEQPFDGADGNLRRIFDRNSKWLEAQANCIPSGEPSSTDIVHQFVSRFLLLVDIWFYNKSSVPDIHQLCHQTLVDLQACLSQQSPDGESCTSAEEGDEDERNDTPVKGNHSREEQQQQQQQQSHLSETIIFQLVAMLLICVSRLQVNGSQTLCGNLVAFTLAVFSQLVEQVAVHIKESVFSLPLAMAGSQQLPPSQAQENGDVPPSSRKTGYSRHIAKLRRRRRRLPLNSEDSDLSDGGEFFYPLSSSSDEANSEGEEPIVLSSEEEEDESDETSSSTQVGAIEAKVNGLPEMQEQCPEKSGNTNLRSDEHKEKYLHKNDQHSKNHKLDEKKESVEQPSAATGQQLQNGVNEGIGNGVAERALEPADVLELMVGEGRLLEAIQVLSDWLKSESNVETLQACGKTRPRTLLTRLVTLLNLLRIDPVRLSAEREVLRGAQDLYLKVPLPEDMQLRGLEPLKEAHAALDWDYFRWHSISPKQASLLRAYKLASFGRYLATIPETGVSYDAASGLLRISSAEDIREESEQPGVEEGLDSNNTTEAGEGDEEQEGGSRGQQLMKQMGRLWLKAEVRELETRVRRLGRGPRLSPYLAVDSAALTLHLPKVRHLVAARRFIVLVPAVVVQALDEMKREVSRAREAIRWLEAQFQRGNRFLRAQRLHERLPLPLIKYPRRKEREAWLFFQVVECCHYFSKQAAAAGGTGDTGPEQAPLVTLLTGVPPDEPATYSPRGVAETAGINMESIVNFYSKWRASNKIQR